MGARSIGLFGILTLSFLAALGPIVTDFYLAALPEVARYFGAGGHLAAASLTMGMAGLAAGQIVIGPLSDRFGRKPLLLFSMALFVLSSLLILFSQNIYAFNALRFVQGFAGAGGIVLSKSVSADLYSGEDLLKFMALLGAVNAVAPVGAPVLGGALLSFTDWRGIFEVILAAGAALFAASFFLKESLPAGNREKGSLLRAYLGLFSVFKEKRFSLAAASSFGAFFTFFAYIAASPFILQDLYGLSPFAFSVIFGINALIIGMGSALSALFKHANTALKAGAIQFVCASVAVAACLIASRPLPALVASYFWMNFAFGLMQPPAASIAMDAGRKTAGAAGAVFGALQFAAGSASGTLAAMGSIRLTSGAVILAGSLFCLAVTLPLCASIKNEALSKKTGL